MKSASGLPLCFSTLMNSQNPDSDTDEDEVIGNEQNASTTRPRFFQIDELLGIPIQSESAHSIEEIVRTSAAIKALVEIPLDSLDVGLLLVFSKATNANILLRRGCPTSKDMVK